MSNRKVFKLSLVAAACMVASAPVFAGQIVGVQQYLPSPQFTDPLDEYKNGFGGWNLDNVNVKIIDIETGLETTKVFNQDTGSYAPAMEVGDGFVSEVMDDSGVVMGTLHGKDWPKGEPSGVKVITTDDIENQSNGRPNSCIMSTSYHPFSDELAWDDSFVLPEGASSEDGVLGTDYINPTLCDSVFQTHKRFKVHALPASIDNGVDIVFNLDKDAGETEVRRYTILQKLNNYTEKRLEGYKIELGFGVGAAFTKNTTLTDQLSLSIEGDGTTVDSNNIANDFWAAEDLAKFSAGLFGLADPPKHPNDGFFSKTSARYDVVLDETKTTISTTGSLTTNYTDLFGNWLPGGWEPSGIFNDDDLDPATDNQLVAFWGLDTDGNYKWLQGQAADFAPVTDAQLYEWATNREMLDEDGNEISKYSVGKIDDMLNLGLNYMVEVGDVSSITYDTFTIRMTPIVDETDDGVQPGWITNAAPTAVIAPPTSGGSSASALGNTGAIAAILAFLGLGGWLARRKLAK